MGPDGPWHLLSVFSASPAPAQAIATGRWPGVPGNGRQRGIRPGWLCLSLGYCGWGVEVHLSHPPQPFLVRRASAGAMDRRARGPRCGSGQTVRGPRCSRGSETARMSSCGHSRERTAASGQHVKAPLATWDTRTYAGTMRAKAQHYRRATHTYAPPIRARSLPLPRLRALAQPASQTTRSVPCGGALGPVRLHRSSIPSLA